VASALTFEAGCGAVVSAQAAAAKEKATNTRATTAWMRRDIEPPKVERWTFFQRGVKLSLVLAPG
jgi:hypothetical protein